LIGCPHFNSFISKIKEREDANKYDCQLLSESEAEIDELM